MRLTGFRLHLCGAILTVWNVCFNASLIHAQVTPDTLRNALTAAGAGVGNGAVSSSLKQLISQDLGTILQVVGKAVTNGLNGLAGALNPELAYSYGQSPPVYPTPPGQGSAGWADAYKQARSLVSKMTNEEKNAITYGVSDTRGCSGFTVSVARLGFPGICLNDAESGVRTGQLVNGYPAQLHVGAAWNRDLALERAIHIGQEFKAKGINVALGPVVGPLGRIAKGGRNWEGFSNDPYLAGELVNPTVQGLQQSVIACVKHFIANEQETYRMPFLIDAIPDLLTQAVSSNFDDQTMHELYLWPFYDAVKAGVGSVMASYNRVNNSHASQNSKILNGLLKTELGFEGFVVSDWNGQYTGVAGANAGLDMAMPNSQFWDNNQLATATKNGSMTKNRLDDMATRIIAAWTRYAKFPDPGMSSRANVDARSETAKAVLLQSAIEGHVLVKNVANALPLKQPRTLSIFGYDAVGGLNDSTKGLLTGPFGLSNTPNYTNGIPFTDAQFALFFASTKRYGEAGPSVALGGTLLSGGGSGAITPASSTSPLDALTRQAKADNTTLYTDLYSSKPTVKAPSDPCLIFVNEQSSESWDRSGLADAYSDSLITTIASQCKNTIVIIHNAGIRLVDTWIDHPNVTAVLYAHLPGQESGNALLEILYGRTSPSGRLPYTVAKRETDYDTLLNPSPTDSKNPQFPQSNFEEGIYIDYKSFIRRNITPRFAFGHGLTYTTFTYSNLQILKNSTASFSTLPPGTNSNTTTSQPADEGGLASLYDVLATVSVSVQNTGPTRASEVAQLYIGIPGGPPKILRGFDKRSVDKGETRQFSFALRRRDLSRWDVGLQSWVLQPGSYTVHVGKSVLDIQVQGQLAIE